MKRSILAPLAGLPGAALAVLLATFAATASEPTTADETGADPLRRTPVVRAVEIAGPAVVNISAERIITVRSDPFWELFGDLVPQDQIPSRSYKAYSLGSGVLIDPEGYIVTNEHVIRSASGIYVSLANSEKTYTADVIASHPEHDVAVIKINADHPLPHVEFADSDKLMTGEVAIAIGNPYGLESTVTTGVVSATRRSIYARGKEIFKEIIQTDAAINPGNSGGALVDIHGRLIGINTAMRYGAENIGFAIPVNKVKQSLEILLDPHELRRVWVGLDLQTGEQNRCVVSAVAEASPADKAGVRPGDVLVSIGGQPVRGAYDYDLYVLKRKVGDAITLDLERKGEPKRVTLTLAAVPKPSGEGLARTLFGLEVRDLTKEDTAALDVKLEGGVLITSVEPLSPAADKRLRKGDVIVKVDRYYVPDLDNLGRRLERSESGAKVLFWVVRDDYLIGNYLTAR